MNPIRIGTHPVGGDAPPFMIAEVGINHNGELEKAFEMIRVAKASGASAVKFQTFKAAEFVADPEHLFTYRSQGQEVTESMLAMFRRHEFSREAWRAIKQRCDDEKITFLSTPQNRSDLDLLLELGIDAIKVGSDDFSNLPLLRDYATAGLPLILSCGMSDLADVHQALETVGALDGHPTILLLCTSQYPTPPEDVHLLKLRTLASAFPMLTLGLSDHTQGALASAVAVGLGARVFEKHFTLSHTLPGPDHWFSEDPAGLESWIRAVRQAHVLLGSPLVRPTAEERKNKPEFRRVLVAGREIRPGELFDRRNLGMRRVPGGNGLPPSMFELMLGKEARRAYQPNEPIQL